MIKFPNDVDGQALLLTEFEAEGNHERVTIPMPWPKLTLNSQAMRPGSVVVIGGPPGFGKTLFCQQIAVGLETPALSWMFSGRTWYYLPLEDRKIDFKRRLLAHVSGLWSVMKDEPAESEGRSEVYMENSDIDYFDRHVCQNPRLPLEEKGTTRVPALPYQEVLAWLGLALKGQNPKGHPNDMVQPARLIFIDSLTFINYGDPPWRGQAEFIQHLVGMTSKAEATVILVAHTRKRHGADKNVLLTGDDLKGAGELCQLAHCVMLLDAHADKESEVFGESGNYTVRHNRTLILDKCRFGKGQGWRFAFDLRQPRFDELGVIIPGQKGKKNESPF